MLNNNLAGTTGIILAGGKSSRFGQDKALAKFGDKTLVEHAATILKPFCSQLLISTNQPEDLAFTGISLISDIFTGCGPIGGIHSGLYHASHQRVLFLGCDMPRIPQSLMQFLEKQLSDFDAVVPCERGFRQTLCLAMKKNTIDAVEQAISQKKFRLLDMLKMINTTYTEVSSLPFYEPGIFLNINYQDDLDQLQRQSR